MDVRCERVHLAIISSKVTEEARVHDRFNRIYKRYARRAFYMDMDMDMDMDVIRTRT